MSLSSKSMQIKKFDRIYTLPEWISKIHEKKKVIRHNGMRFNLRVATILKTSLTSAEAVLRLRQTQRALCFSEIQFGRQIKIKDINDEESLNKSHYFHGNNSSTINNKADEEKLVKDLWNTELSGLDQFFNNLSNFKISARST